MRGDSENTGPDPNPHTHTHTHTQDVFNPQEVILQINLIMNPIISRHVLAHRYQNKRAPNTQTNTRCHYPVYIIYNITLLCQQSEPKVIQIEVVMQQNVPFKLHALRNTMTP